MIEIELRNEKFIMNLFMTRPANTKWFEKKPCEIGLTTCYWCKNAITLLVYSHQFICYFFQAWDTYNFGPSTYLRELEHTLECFDWTRNWTKPGKILIFLLSGLWKGHFEDFPLCALQCDNMLMNIADLWS